MPQSSSTSRPRPEDRDRTAKAQEQEFKRARGAISCAECRRLKLKCDKTVPCSSCKRRGCSSICPNGSLTTGQGTRFILADTDRLHGKIAEMSDRIRQLEDALTILQSSTSREQHPLLRRDLLKIKSGLELHSAMNVSALDADEPPDEDEESQYIDAFGTLAVRDDGAATFYGRSAGSESLLLDEKTELEETSLPPAPNGMQPLPDRIMRLVSSFPSAPSSVPDNDLPELIGYLPPWPRAAQLCHLYLEQAPWFFGAVTERQLAEEVLPLFFSEASAPEALSSSSAAFNLPPAHQFAGGSTSRSSSHDLALVFVVFCFGALTDSELPPAPHNIEAERYFQLARAALNLEPVLERPPSVVTVQTLSLMAIYQGLIADEHSIESTWALMGLSSKLAQSIGLHRDCARWKLSPAEVQKRRALFWELFITDCWQSLATGRLPTFSLPFVDTELPGDPDQTISDDGTVQPGFPLWKARWGKECVADVVQGTLTSRAPKYTVILELDRKLRDLPLPKYAQGPPPRGLGLRETMLHFMPINYRELTLLYVHRCFFAQALTDYPTDPLRSPYAPSFLAGYRSACALLATLREQYAMFPVQIARFWVLWTHAFSSSVMLASVVTHGGTTKTAQAALGELRLAYDLFENAAKHGGRAVKFLPVIRRLHDKAYNCYTQGIQPRKDIFAARTAGDEQHDELSIFSGRTRTVATKSKTPPSHNPRSASRRRPGPTASGTSSSAPTPPDSTSSASGSGSGRDSLSPKSTTVETFPALESYENMMHPMLVDQMRTFHDGSVRAGAVQYVVPAS
ncbi:fungal-specific transcription factor domain-containing protein [Amylocystis lapponica]|nr:fungal-specific transcription factor domain-containing protein [Amylocystis lapponica]